jgi:DNA-binding transcriptional MerR regulator
MTLGSEKMEMQITTFEIEKALIGMKRANLQQWIEKGFIRPSIERACGVGTRNLFSEGDVFQIMLLLLMQESGVPLRQGRMILDEHIEEINGMLADKKMAWLVMGINSMKERRIEVIEKKEGECFMLNGEHMAVQIFDMCIVNERKKQVIENIKNVKYVK